MLAATDGAIVAEIIALAFAIISGGLAMAWRLGKLEQTVNDSAQKAEDAKRAAQAAQRDVGQLRAIIDRRQGWLQKEG